MSPALVSESGLESVGCRFNTRLVLLCENDGGMAQQYKQLYQVLRYLDASNQHKVKSGEVSYELSYRNISASMLVGHYQMIGLIKELQNRATSEKMDENSCQSDIKTWELLLNLLLNEGVYIDLENDSMLEFIEFRKNLNGMDSELSSFAKWVAKNKSTLPEDKICDFLFAEMVLGRFRDQPSVAGS